MASISYSYRSQNYWASITHRLLVDHRQQSAISKKMAPRAAIWVDRHIGLKFTVFVWEFDGKQLSLKMNSNQDMNSEITNLVKRLYSPNLRDVAVLERVQWRFKILYICMQVGGGKIIDKCLEN